MSQQGNKCDKCEETMFGPVKRGPQHKSTYCWRHEPMNFELFLEVAKERTKPLLDAVKEEKDED